MEPEDSGYLLTACNITTHNFNWSSAYNTNDVLVGLRCIFFRANSQMFYMLKHKTKTVNIEPQ